MGTLNNLISKSDFAPTARETNTKTSVDTNNNRVRDMFMTFNASQQYKPVWLPFRICNLQPEIPYWYKKRVLNLDSSIDRSIT